MKIGTNSIILAVLMVGCFSCDRNDSHQKSAGLYDFVVLDENNSVGERTIKLSELVDDYEVVKFENSDSALFKVRKPVVSENYIAVIQGGMDPVVLFDRKGNYIGNIGNVGSGPGEYMTAYDALIDEANGRIYITQMVNGQVLEYDLEGKYQGTHQIGSLNKPTLFANGDESISLVNIAFDDAGVPLTAATFGNASDSVVRLIYQPLVTSFRDASGAGVGFNNEVWAFRNTPNNAFMLTFNDTLYTYNSRENVIAPRAVFKELSDKSSDTWYVGLEFPTAIIYQVMGSDSRTMWYDKSSAELSRATIINDFCGNAKESVSNFRDGYYVHIWEPGRLMDRIEERWLPENEMTAQQREDLKELFSELNPDDDNIMFIGKMKNI